MRLGTKIYPDLYRHTQAGLLPKVYT